MHIQSYVFGKIQIDDQSFSKDVVLSNNSIVPNWRRAQGHRLSIQDIEKFINEFEPEILIIGTGMWGILKVPNDLHEKLLAMGMDVRVEKTKKACELYNANQHRKIMAALHINC